jgi:hypothetical protein
VQDHGYCCICEGTEDVNVLVLVELRAPEPGTGWGCVVCHQPCDGAIAVICERCERECPTQADAVRRLRWVCRGYVMGGHRAPIESLDPAKFSHDPMLHDELADLSDYTVGVWP